MSHLPDIDASIDRLDEAVRGAGLRGLDAPSDNGVLEAIAEAIAPYALAEDLRRFWERVAPSSIPVRLFPELQSAASALELHRIGLDETIGQPVSPPPLLFPIGYSSHVYWSSEVASSGSDGGTIFWWAWDEDEYRIAYRGLAELLDAVGEIVAEGAAETIEGDLHIPLPAEEAKRSERRQRAGAHPLYGELAAIPKELAAWPAHWLEASGIDLGDRAPLGSTHTVAELVAAASRGPVTGRIRGTVVRVVGLGSDRRVVVEDGTGALDVWCPAGTSQWGPVNGGRFEFDVAIEQPLRPPPALAGEHAEIVSHALAGRLGDAQAAAAELIDGLGKHRAEAVASAIRPLE